MTRTSLLIFFFFVVCFINYGSVAETGVWISVFSSVLMLEKFTVVMLEDLPLFRMGKVA